MASPHARDDDWADYNQQSQRHERPSVFASQSQNPAQPPPPRPTRKKAKHHRRRHVPVGPAGVWFQVQQNDPGLNKRTTRPEQEEQEEETGIEFTQGTTTKVARSVGVAFYSPAWISMQCDLGFVTPSLPAYLSQDDRYTACRPHIPGQFHMIPEVLAGQADWKLEERRLLVLVHAIESLAGNLWVAELTDETGAKISCWIQPRLVQQEQQRQLPKYIRPGLVWLLRDTTLLLVAKEEEDASYGRMLLVGEHNIERVWTPANGEEGISDDDYIKWMEKRNALTATVNEAADIQQNDLLEYGDMSARPGDQDQEIIEDDRETPSHLYLSRPRRPLGSQPSSEGDRVDSQPPVPPTRGLPVGASSESVERHPASAVEASAARDTADFYKDVASSVNAMPAISSPGTAPSTTETGRERRSASAERNTPPAAFGSAAQSVSARQNRDKTRRPGTQQSALPTGHASLSQSPRVNVFHQFAAPVANRHLEQPSRSPPVSQRNNNEKSPFQTTLPSTGVTPQSSSNCSGLPADSTASGLHPSQSPLGIAGAPSVQHDTTPKGTSQRKQSRSSSKKKRKSAERTSPKHMPSNLWTSDEACMFEMLDDDESLEELTYLSASTRKSPMGQDTTTKTSVGSVGANQEESNAKLLTRPTSLFQTSAFASMGMDDLFDEDDC
jgi:hypothetical protein